MPDTPRSVPEDPSADPATVAGLSGEPDQGPPPNNLPIELSSFVGRVREVSEVEALLSGHLLPAGGDGQRDKIYRGEGRDSYWADKEDYMSSSCEVKLPNSLP